MATQSLSRAMRPCDDILDLVGKAVINKRQEVARAYWEEIYSSRVEREVPPPPPRRFTVFTSEMAESPNAAALWQEFTAENESPRNDFMDAMDDISSFNPAELAELAACQSIVAWWRAYYEHSCWVFTERFMFYDNIQNGVRIPNSPLWRSRHDS
jgi:hypothetical protein